MARPGRMLHGRVGDTRNARDYRRTPVVEPTINIAASPSHNNIEHLVRKTAESSISSITAIRNSQP